MSRCAAALATALMLGTLSAPALAEWRCRQGRVELIVGGAQGCTETPAATTASASPSAGPQAVGSQRQRDQDRRTILETELRQEQAALAVLQKDGRPADPAARRRVQDNIDALLRELARTATPR